MSKADIDFLQFLWLPDGDASMPAVEHRMLVNLGLLWCVEDDMFKVYITVSADPTPKETYCQL